MASSIVPFRPLCCWKTVFRDAILPTTSRRCASSLQTARSKLPSDLPACFISQLPARLRQTDKREIKIHPPPPSHLKLCKDPIATFTDRQLSILDPTGVRMRLFRRTPRKQRPDPDAIKVGDVLLVNFRSGDPFSGVLLSIRNRGIDTAILLRNQLTRVGVEMWVKVLSPNVEGIEVVERSEKRARRARLYYMRQPKHDRGSVQDIMYQHIRRKQALRASAVKENTSGTVVTQRT